MASTSIDFNIPSVMNDIISSDCIIKQEWDQVISLIQPFPEQHMILSTSAPNNTLILAMKIYESLSLKLNEFKVFTVPNDVYDADRNHGIYSHQNKYFYMDMKRVRYDDYKYMIRILESIIYAQRITTSYCIDSKIVIVVNNFDLVLQQYLVKFIKYADTLAANVSFIFIGSGVINYYARATKLKSLCIVRRCNFIKITDIVPQLSSISTIKNNNPDSQILADMLYNFTDGDIIKTWLIMQIYINTGCTATLNSSSQKKGVDTVSTELQIQSNTIAATLHLFNEYILPNMPILNSLYELLHLLKRIVNNGSYSITPVMNRLYILHSYPDMNITRLINMIFKLFMFIHKYNTPTTHPLYLTNTQLITLNKLCNEFICLDKIKPYTTNESILILRGFITKLLLFLAN